MLACDALLYRRIGWLTNAGFARIDLRPGIGSRPFTLVFRRTTGCRGLRFRFRFASRRHDNDLLAWLPRPNSGNALAARHVRTAR